MALLKLAVASAPEPLAAADAEIVRLPLLVSETVASPSPVALASWKMPASAVLPRFARALAKSLASAFAWALMYNPTLAISNSLAFANIPDAPISQFNLNIQGGKTGILAVTRTRKAKINLCAGRHIAEVDNDGQNGRRHDYDVRMKTPCSKRQTRNAKRAAKKAARKARSARS